MKKTHYNIRIVQVINFWFLILFISCFYQHVSGQSVTLLPGSQGINVDNPKDFQLKVDGIYAGGNIIIEATPPQNNNFLINCGTGIQTIKKMSGVISDPSGNSPYPSGVFHNCLALINLTDSISVKGIQLDIEQISLGLGDTVLVIDAINFDTLVFVNQPSVLNNSNIIAMQTLAVAIVFKTNADNSVGEGFRISWRAMKLQNNFQNYPENTPLFVADLLYGNLLFGTQGSLSSPIKNTISLGIFNRVQDRFNVVIGNFNSSNSAQSNIVGLNNHVSGGSNSVFGISNNITGSNNLVLGDQNETKTGFSVNVGRNNKILSQSSVALGNGLITNHDAQTALGKYNDTTKILGITKAFEIGIGTPDLRKTALTILQNGNIGINTNNPTEKLEVNGSLKINGGINLEGQFRTNNNISVANNLNTILNNRGSRIHVYNGVSGTTEGNTGHIVRLENNEDAFLSIAIPADKKGGIQFFKPTASGFSSQFIGSIRLSETNNFDFRLGENSTRMRLTPQGDLQIGMGVSPDGCLKDGNGTELAGTCASDSRYKKDIVSFRPLLADFVKLNPVNFNWRVEEFPDKGFGTEQSYGFIAQEVEKVFPYLVKSDERGFKAVNYSKLQIMSIQAIKELTAENALLKNLIMEQGEALINQLKAQEDRINALEAKIISEKESMSNSK